MIILTYLYVFFFRRQDILLAARGNSARERFFFFDPQFGIFPAELPLGDAKTQMPTEVVPEEIRS